MHSNRNCFTAVVVDMYLYGYFTQFFLADEILSEVLKPMYSFGRW